MDVGNKTLAQLSEEAKEKQYVTLEVGAKVSGYTKEYLEHLCHLNKVEFRMWNKGQFVIELESLLTETHTILLSYEDINFVDKETLDDPTPQIVSRILTSRMQPIESIANAKAAKDEVKEKLRQKVQDGITQTIPSFGEVAGEKEDVDDMPTLSRMGRSVVSDPLHREIEKTAEKTEVLRAAALSIPKKVETPKIVPEATVITPPHHPVHLAINGDTARTSTSVSAVVEKPHPAVHLQVTGDAGYIEKKIQPEAALSVEKTIEPRPSGVAAPMVPPPISSSMANRTLALHPIQTSIDATLHHDPAPLFPLIQKITETTPSAVAVSQEAQHTLPGIPYLGANSRVVVFSDVSKEEEASTLPPATKTEQELLRTLSRSNVPGRPTPRGAMGRQPMIPALQGQKSLMLREEHSLVRSPALNIAFVACLIFSAIAIGGFFPGSSGLVSDKNIAAVATSDIERGADVGDSAQIRGTPPTSRPAESQLVLPFSDDVIISTSTTPNTVIVQPLFYGEAGREFEYTIVPSR